MYSNPKKGEAKGGWPARLASGVAACAFVTLAVHGWSTQAPVKVSDLAEGAACDGAAQVGLVQAPAILLPGEKWASADCMVQLLLQGDGNLVAYRGEEAVWSSKTFTDDSIKTATKLAFQDDGNLVLSDAQGTVVWKSDTAGQGFTQLEVVAGAPRMLGPYCEGAEESGVVVPTATLLQGQWWASADCSVQLLLQADGNLVTYRDGKALWSTATTSATSAVWQGDGNLVLSDAHGSVVWKSDTAGQGFTQLEVVAGAPRLLGPYCEGAALSGVVVPTATLLQGQWWASADCTVQLLLQGDGNLVTYRDGKALWSTATTTATSLVWQGDGHLILLDAHGDVVWKTDTSGQGYVALAVAAGPPQLLKTTQPDGFCLNAEVVGPVSLRSELLINEHWVSGDCLYILFLGDDGNVAIYDSDHSAHSAPRWSTGPNPGAVRMVLQEDGNLVVLAGDDQPLWHSKTADMGYTGLTVDDGVLRFRGGHCNGAVGVGDLAPFTLHVGQHVASADCLFKLVLQDNGELVSFNSLNQRVWGSRTADKAVQRLEFQGDGNLVLYTADGSAVWQTESAGLGYEFMRIAAEGSPVLVPAIALRSSDEIVLMRVQPRNVLYAPGGGEEGGYCPGAKAIGDVGAPFELFSNEWIASDDCSRRLLLQNDGNVVMMDRTGATLWQTRGDDIPIATYRDFIMIFFFIPAIHTYANPGQFEYRMLWQTDGNMVVSRMGGPIIWHASTENRGLRVIRLAERMPLFLPLPPAGAASVGCQALSLGSAALNTPRKLAKLAKLRQGLTDSIRLELTAPNVGDSRRWNDGTVEGVENWCDNEPNSDQEGCTIDVGCWKDVSCDSVVPYQLCTDLSVASQRYYRNVQLFGMSRRASLAELNDVCSANNMFTAELRTAADFAAVRAVSAQGFAALTGVVYNSDDGKYEYISGRAVADDSQLRLHSAKLPATGAWQLMWFSGRLRPVPSGVKLSAVLCSAQRLLRVAPCRKMDGGFLEYFERFTEMMTATSDFDGSALMHGNAPFGLNAENDGTFWLPLSDRLGDDSFGQDRLATMENARPIELSLSTRPESTMCLRQVEVYHTMHGELTRVAQATPDGVAGQWTMSGTTCSKQFIEGDDGVLSMCLDKPLSVNGRTATVFTVDFSSCQLADADAPFEDLAFMITGELADGKLENSNRFSMKNDVTDTFAVGRDKTFSVVLPDLEMVKLTSLTLINSGMDDFCLDSVRINGEEMRSLTQNWILGGGTTKRCAGREANGKNECPPYTVASWEFAVCKLEVLATRPNVDGAKAEKQGAAVVSGMICRNSDRLDSQECTVEQSYETDLTVEHTFEFSTEESATSSFSTSSSTTTSFDQSLGVSVSAGIEFGTKLVRGSVGVEVSSESTWGREASKAYDSGQEWTTGKTQTNGESLSTTVSNTIGCSATATVPPSHQIEYSLIFEKLQKTLPTYTDVKITLCPDPSADTKTYTPEYKYILDIPGEIKVKGATRCEVNFMQPEMLPNRMTCSEEQVLQMLTGADWMPECREDKPAQYKPCQCQDVNSLTTASCACYDPQGNPRLDGKARRVTDSSQATCDLLDCRDD